MDKRAQLSGLGGIIIYMLIGFVLIGLSGWITQVGKASTAELTGITGFFFGNMILVIGFFYVLGFVVLLKYG